MTEEETNSTEDLNFDDKEWEDSVMNNVCRICYCSNEEETLITPCQCSGSVQFIHQSCLMTWLQLGANHCEICKVPYHLQKVIKPYHLRIRPHITSWHLAWIVKELVVLDWFHFLETVFICLSLMIINRMSSYDLVYQFALIGLIELFYYGLNICSCFFLLYYKRWAKLNMDVNILNYNDVMDGGSIGVFFTFLENYANLLEKNKRLEQVVEVINQNDGEI